MAKMVGLSRSLKLQWLNIAAEYSSGNLAEEEMKKKLNDYLGYEIESPTNIRKTREILMNIWFYENEYSGKLLPAARHLITEYPEYSMEIHWCMMLAAYPVFGDICRLIGKMSEFQTELTLAQIKQKLFDEWGERATLFHSIDKLVATLKALDVLVSDKPGKYHINRHQVNATDVSSFMVYSMMLIDANGYYSFQEINSSDYLFPFDYRVGKEVLLQDDRFIMSNLGGELSVALKVT